MGLKEDIARLAETDVKPLVQAPPADPWDRLNAATAKACDALHALQVSAGDAARETLALRQLLRRGMALLVDHHEGEGTCLSRDQAYWVDDCQRAGVTL